MPTTIVGVYRHGNAKHVQELIQPALTAGWQVGWWALDQRHDRLREVTVGEGQGLKLPLVNETLRRLEGRDDWTIISDDDLRFRVGNVVSFLQMCKRSDLDLAQPARARHTEQNFEITTKVTLSRARTTTFVESGPLYAIGPRFRERLLPLPEDRGMGWGLELDWYDLLQEGCRLGIIDSVAIEHLGETAGEYAWEEMRGRVKEELRGRGVRGWREWRETHQRTLAVWRPWQKQPPWAELQVE